MPTSEKLSSSQQETRAKLIKAAEKGWIDRLIDTSRRNNLLYYRAVPTGTIEVSPTSEPLEELLSGKAVMVQELLGPGDSRPGRALNIARKAQENSEEKGLQTLYLALGFATWKADDGGRDPRAPIFLLPVEMRRKGRDLAALEVQVAGEPKLNPVLIHILETEHSIKFDEEDLLESVAPSLDSVDTENSTATARYVHAVTGLASFAGSLKTFTTDFASSISNFSFAKLALVNDLKGAGDLLLNNDVVAAISGDAEARGALGGAQISVEPGTLDALPPDAEFCVVEADSSQQCAVNGIAAGQNAVIHGPPGTGKSQTITNLIATLVATGNKVLFVAEKRAALEVVLQRLERAGLDHLAMDLHGAELSPKKVMEKVARTLTLVRNSRTPHPEDIHRQFQDRRAKLNQHDATMHQVSGRSGKSVFDMQAGLLRLPGELKTSIRWRGAELAVLTAVQAERIRDLLRQASPLESLLTGEDPSAWTPVRFTNANEVQRAVDLAQNLATESIPHLNEEIRELQARLSIAVQPRHADIADAVGLLSSAKAWLQKYDDAIFATDLSTLLAELAPAANGGLKGLWAAWFASGVKEARRRSVVLRKGIEASAKELHKELSELASIGQRWKVFTEGASLPTVYERLDSLAAADGLVSAEAAKLQRTVDGKRWGEMSLPDLAEKVAPFAADSDTPYRVLQLSDIEKELKSLGVGRLVEDIKQRRPASVLWGCTFDFAWLNSALDEMAIQYPEIKSFIGATHNQYVEEFKRLDVDRLKLAKDRVRRKHAENTIAAMNAHPAQEGLIRQEAAKARRFKPLRKVFQEAGDVMTAVCPCWMASPLSVAQLIHPDVRFDYVIFDEASQILPEDSIPSIIRAKYVVVAGDNHQLPPTGFFASGVEEGDDETEATGFESLLDMMLPFARSFHLNWHYRSRDESLIAFSNHHIYDDRLVTFPGPGGGPAVTHDLVNHVPTGDGEEESSSGEVRRVVELVIRHAEQRPTKTLGVISMGIKHAMRIQTAFDAAQRERPDLAEFFDQQRPERFFIKNLERVQGDERDCIILTVGYGKDRAGNLPLRFGPILSAGGRRRLNVAVTRAREKITLVSSFSYVDLDLAKVREGTGLEFLRNYIQFAASGGKVISHGELSNEPMNDFEADICEALTARGMSLVPQVGCSSFRIDFGVCHPTQPGRFVMAIEADGATYHSSYTARDRDRLRQQMLENLGWTFHRIWSTDWFHKKSDEIERAVAAYERAVKNVDAPLLPNLTVQEEVVPEIPMDAELSAGRSSTFPPIPKRSSITDYTQTEMRALYAWVMSDGRLRTHDEIADEMFEALPFSRRGARIEAVLREAIRRCERVRL